MMACISGQGVLPAVLAVLLAWCPCGCHQRDRPEAPRAVNDRSGAAPPNKSRSLAALVGEVVRDCRVGARG